MKKTLSLLVALLAWFGAVAQEPSDEVDNTPELVFTARGDINPFIPGYKKAGLGGYDYTHSGLYGFLDGNIGKHFSYSACAHFLGPYVSGLYDATFRSDFCNWLDWCNFTWHISDNFDFALGKIFFQTGSFELSYNDVDSHDNLSSVMWSMSQCYQWGASLAATTNSESTTLTFHFGTSQWGEKPFKSKLFQYAINWQGEYGCYKSNSSIALMEYDRGEFVKHLCLGNRFEFEKTALELDYTVESTSLKELFSQRSSLVLKTIFQIGKNDHWEIFAKGGWEFDHTYDDIFTEGSNPSFYGTIVPSGIAPGKDYIFYGAGVNWYPLSDRRLRIHLAATANNYAGCACILMGATYNLNLTKLIKTGKPQL